MKAFRCQNCGETYLGDSIPDRCPYCGAASHHLVPPAEWIDYGIVPMSEWSLNQCRHTLEIELSNSAFYRSCAEKAELNVNAAIFSRLADQEEEHAELVGKMSGLDEPLEPMEVAPNNDADKFTEAHVREKRAVLLYQKIAREAPENRVREVFRILSEIEGEHLKLSNIYR